MSLSNREKEALDKEIMDIPESDGDDAFFWCPECSGTEYTFNSYETAHTTWYVTNDGFLTERVDISWSDEWDDVWVTCTRCDTEYDCTIKFDLKSSQFEVTKIDVDNPR